MTEESFHTTSCEPPFWIQPSILFQSYHLNYERTCKHSAWNFLARIMILSLFIGFIGTAVAGLAFIPVSLLFGGITAFAIIMIDSIKGNKPSSNGYDPLPIVKTVDPSQSLERTTESFVNGGAVKGGVQPIEDPIGSQEIDAAPYSGPALPDHTPPTSRNLFMNVLLDEIKYNPDRPSAASVQNPAVEQVMDDFFRIQWHSDPTDVYGKKQSQRQFITQPSTTIPNDQGSFANWLYKIPGKTCKEGGRPACALTTDQRTIPWLSAL